MEGVRSRGFLAIREIQTMNSELLILQDSELTSASDQINEMIERLKKLDNQYRELRRCEQEGQNNLKEWKEKYTESRLEVEHLKSMYNQRCHFYDISMS